MFARLGLEGAGDCVFDILKIYPLHRRFRSPIARRCCRRYDRIFNLKGKRADRNGAHGVAPPSNPQHDEADGPADYTDHRAQRLHGFEIGLIVLNKCKDAVHKPNL